MNHKLIFGFLIMLMTSCATIMTRKNYKMTISSNAPNAKVIIYDSLYNLPITLKVNRSKNDLKIKLFSDSLTKDFIVKSSPNPTFLYGNLLWMQVSPAAYLIDFTNQKRFYFGKSVFLNIYDSVKVIRPPVSRFYYNYFSKTYPTNKGQINLVFSIPLVNSFYFQPQLENKKINTGFGGISSSVEYYYKNNKFFGLSGNAVVDYFVPFPVGVDISGGYETMNSVYLSITDNFKFKRFSVGYGLNYSKNNWAYKFSNRFNPPPPTRTPESKSSQSFGFTFNVYHQFSKNFFVGLIYRPSFIKIYPTTELKYEHLLSLDFTWKIRLKN